MISLLLLACALPPEPSPESQTGDTGYLVLSSASPRSTSGSPNAPRTGLKESSVSKPPDQVEQTEHKLPQTVLWGDPHAHSGLSPDGCESPEADCVAEVDGAPGRNMASRAADNGLDWFALTDHVEFGEYIDRRTGEHIPIWDSMLELVSSARSEGDVTLYAGYEWRDCYRSGTHHRTVLFESASVCTQLRPPACAKAKTPKETFGLESYGRRSDVGMTEARGLEQLLQETAEQPECETRWVAFAHHSAYARPGGVDWDQSSDRMDNELLLEIFSEHGSSECVDLDQPGCEYWVNRGQYQARGSAQAALQAGQMVGFVAGTDSHDANPGSTEDGPGPVAKLTELDGKSVSEVTFQAAPGGVTAALLHPGQAPYKEAVFDALLARHTVASTTVLDGFELWVRDPMGRIFLPGDQLPAGAYRLHLNLPYSYTVELVDKEGTAELVDDWFTLQVGEPRYLRVRLSFDDQEHRIWASPFYPL